MTHSPDNAEIRRSRLQCYFAAAIFVVCALVLLVLPIAPPAVRWVLAGFNVIVGIAAGLYGRQLGRQE